jgi:hypothetical protein
MALLNAYGVLRLQQKRLLDKNYTSLVQNMDCEMLRNY